MGRPTLVIGNHNYSSWSLRPWLLMRVLGIDFDCLRIPLDTPDTAAAIARYSAAGRVPVLVDGAISVWDSLAICEYLAEDRPEAWPAERSTRAWARSVSAEMHSGFAALRAELPMNCRSRIAGLRPTPAAADDIERVRSLWRECRAAHADRGPFLFGAFSIADAMYAPVALRFVTYGVALGATEQAYVAALLGLPAMQEWLAAAEAESEVIEAAELRP